MDATESPCVIVTTTWPAEGANDAADTARALVESGFAACVQVSSEVLSVYRWQGVVEQAAERVLSIKTTQARVAALQERLATLHPYDVPEFVVTPILGGSDAYLTWVRTSVAPATE